MTNRKLKEQQVRDIIKRLEQRYDEDMADGGAALHKHIVEYVQPHFHRRPSVTPKPPDPWSQHGIQWPGITTKHRELKARLTENEPTIDLDPVVKNSDGEEAAEKGQAYFADLMNQWENSLGYGLMPALCDGLIDGAGVLHWYMNPYDKMPDYDEVDDFGDEPDDDDEKKKYEKRKARYTEDEYAPELGRTKKKKYREKDDEYLQRVGAKRARHGIWRAEVIGLEKVYLELDKSPRSQFKRVLYTREVDVATWWDMREEAGGFDLKDVDLSEAGDVPTIEVMSQSITGDQWGKSVKLKQLWDREYCYELVDDEAVPEKLRFQCYPHPYGMPPFALMTGAVIRNDEPRLMYQSPYELLFQLKPMFDRWITLSMILAESQSIPRYVLVNKGTGAPRLNEKGDGVLLLSPDQAGAMEIPEGWEIQKFGGEGVNSDFKGQLEWLDRLLQQSAPDTGRSTFGASTQPWSARIEQAQNNMEPKMYLTSGANALKVMVQNMVDVMAKPLEEGGPGTVWFMQNSDRGAKTEKVEPETWAGLRAEVNIDPVSAAEKGAKVEQAMIWLKEKLITPVDFYGDMGLGLPNPQEKWAEVLATFSFIEGPLPGILRKEQALALGSEFAYTPADKNGVSQFIDGTGSVVSAADVARGGGAPASAVDVTPQRQMGGMPNLQAPGAEGPMNPLGGAVV